MPSAAVRLAGVTITSPDKLFWPGEGITKLDLAQFYLRLASFLVPWTRQRALMLERCPEGLKGSCFIQKQAPAHLPPGIPTMTIAAPTARRDVDYVLGGKRRTILALANLGCIAVHVMNSRIDKLDLPDWFAFDLDPSAGFADAARAAMLLRERLEDHGLEAYVKTSGGRGLHVLVPLRRGPPQDRVRAYAASIARELASRHPALVTVESRKAKRRAPVYLDVQRNGRGETIVPPFSVRWRPRAPVSMPLAWNELTPRLDPAVFNIRTAERRLTARDPWTGFFGHRQTLPRL
jgi:bifunctional non-homologous end joining protein LigD